MTNKEFLTLIQKETNKIDFDRYLKQLVLKKVSVEENIATFEVPNKYLASWIKSKHLNTIQNSFETFNGTKPQIDIKIVGEKKARKDTQNTQDKNQASESTILNPSYVFDSFVVGPSNQMVYNASLAIATKPGIQYNPLFIYGGTGLGKTHILQAIGNHSFLEKNIEIVMFY